MKTFKLTSTHDVYKDDFINGEIENINFYVLSSEIKAENQKQAVEKYFHDFLVYAFELKYAQICEDGNTVYYCTLVDIKNTEATEADTNLWKNQKLTLYANNISVQCFELKLCNF